MKALARSSYGGARNGSGCNDPPPAAPPRVATRGRASLSEHLKDIRVRTALSTRCRESSESALDMPASLRSGRQLESENRRFGNRLRFAQIGPRSSGLALIGGHLTTRVGVSLMLRSQPAYRAKSNGKLDGLPQL